MQWLLLLGAAITVARQTDRTQAVRPPPGAALAKAEVHAPPRLRGVATGETDSLGRPVRVACVNWHSLRAPSALPESVAALDEFHQGLKFQHASLRCGACHVAGDQTELHLADGTRISMTDAMLLCRQCHGTQARDYDHGAHGGMMGFWDLSAGPRTRNHCVDCHDAHVPQFQPTQPVLPPRDRGMTARKENR